MGPKKLTFMCSGLPPYGKQAKTCDAFLARRETAGGRSSLDAGKTAHHTAFTRTSHLTGNMGTLLQALTSRYPFIRGRDFFFRTFCSGRFLSKHYSVAEPITTRLGFKMFTKPGRDYTSDWLRVWRELETGTERFILGNMCDGGTFIDIGSNVGFFTLAVASHFPRAKVWAFEPNPDVASILERSLEMNGFSDRVRVHRLAISDVEGTVDFIVDDANSGHCRLGQPSHATRTFGVRSIIWDQWVKSTDADVVPTVIKIDIEGAETKAIRGMRNFLIQHRPHLILEAFDNQLQEFGSSQVELIRLTEELGYRQVQPITDGNLVLKHQSHCRR